MRRWSLAFILLAAVIGVGGSVWRLVDIEPEASVLDVPRPRDWNLLPPELREVVREATAHCEQEPSIASFSNLARIYHGNGEAVLALRCYERAFELGSTDPRDAYLAGIIHESFGDSARALERLETATRLAPAYGPAHLHLGRTRLDAGDIEGAIEALDRAVDIEPRDAWFHTSRGAALRQAGRLEDAASALRTALEIEPEHGPAHQLLGLTLQALGETDAAAEHLGRLRRYTGEVLDDPWLYEVQQRAASLEVVLDVVEGYLAAQRYDSALRQLEEILESYDDRARVFKLLGRARMGAGRPQEAVRAYLKATQLEPHDPQAHASLALILLDYDNLDGAAHEMRLTLEADPAHPQGLMVKGALEVKAGRYEAALDILGPLIERRSAMAAGHVWIGEAHAGLEQWDEAASAFRRALEIDPTIDYARRRLEAVTSRAGGP